MIPVVDLVIEIGHALRTVAEPNSPAVPVAASVDDVADRAVVDTLHRLTVAGLVPALRAGADGEFLDARYLLRLQDATDAGAVDADWLLGEDVLAGGHRGGDMEGTET